MQTTHVVNNTTYVVDALEVEEYHAYKVAVDGLIYEVANANTPEDAIAVVRTRMGIDAVIGKMAPGYRFERLMSMYVLTTRGLVDCEELDTIDIDTLWLYASTREDVHGGRVLGFLLQVINRDGAYCDLPFRPSDFAPLVDGRRDGMRKKGVEGSESWW